VSITVSEARMFQPGAQTLDPLMPRRWDADDGRQVRAHLQTALDALAKRKPLVDARWRYYLGEHDQLWMTSKLKEIFGQQFKAKLEDNWCELAIEAVVLRLELAGWTVRREDKVTAAAAEQMVAAVNAQMEANGLDIEQEEVHRVAGIAGEHYLMVWPRYANPDDPDDDTQAVDEDGVPLYDITEQDARNVYVQRGAGGRVKVFDVKVWRDDAEKRWRATVYYADEVVRLRTVRNSNGGEPPKAERFELDPDDPGGDNPMGAPPFVRFAKDKRGRSRLDSLSPVNDKINKLAVGKIIAAEFAILGQRYALTDQPIPDNALRNVPGSVWTIDPGGDGENGTTPPTRVGQFEVADISQFDSAKREEVDTFLTLAMLPKNLRQSAGGSASSGEQVTKDSGPFVSMVEDHQQMYGAAWRDLWSLCGYDVEPAWEPAAFANDKDVAEEVKLWTDAGVPLTVALQHVGWSADDLKAVQDALDDTETKRANASADALRQLDEGRGALARLNAAAGVGGGLTGGGSPATV